MLTIKKTIPVMNLGDAKSLELITFDEFENAIAENLFHIVIGKHTKKEGKTMIIPVSSNSGSTLIIPLLRDSDRKVFHYSCSFNISNGKLMTLSKASNLSIISLEKKENVTLGTKDLFMVFGTEGDETHLLPLGSLDDQIILRDSDREVFQYPYKIEIDLDKIK